MPGMYTRLRLAWQINLDQPPCLSIMCCSVRFSLYLLHFLPPDDQHAMHPHWSTSRVYPPLYDLKGRKNDMGIRRQQNVTALLSMITKFVLSKF